MPTTVRVMDFFASKIATTANKKAAEEAWTRTIALLKDATKQTETPVVLQIVF